jgi:hypothetical protein
MNQRCNNVHSVVVRLVRSRRRRCQAARSRSTGWFLISLVVSPVFGLLLLIAFTTIAPTSRPMPLSAPVAAFLRQAKTGPRDWVQAGMGKRSVWPQAVALAFLVTLVLSVAGWWSYRTAADRGQLTTHARRQPAASVRASRSSAARAPGASIAPAPGDSPIPFYSPRAAP